MLGNDNPTSLKQLGCMAVRQQNIKRLLVHNLILSTIKAHLASSLTVDPQLLGRYALYTVVGGSNCIAGV